MLKVKRPDEVGQTSNPKYCTCHRLISHLIDDCFVLKGKIQDLIDSGIIHLPKGSVKAPINQASVAKDALDKSKPQKPNDNEMLDSGEDQTGFESKGTEKRWEHANTVKITKRKVV